DSVPPRPRRTSPVLQGSIRPPLQARRPPGARTRAKPVTLGPPPDWPRIPDAMNEARPTIAGPRRLRLLTDEELDDLPKPEWLVDGALPARSLILLFGDTGVGKSFLALDWAASIATGTAWHGRPVKQG